MVICIEEQPNQEERCVDKGDRREQRVGGLATAESKELAGWQGWGVGDGGVQQGEMEAVLSRNICNSREQ